MCTTCMPAVMVCVTVNLDVPRFWSNAEYFYPRPPFSIHTLLLVSLTVRCCEINGHSEIDLSPRRGKEGRTSEKKNQQQKAANNKNMPELIKFPCSYQRPHTTPRDTREITYGMAIFSYDDIDRPHCQYQLHQYTKYGQLSNNI